MYFIFEINLVVVFIFICILAVLFVVVVAAAVSADDVRMDKQRKIYIK